MRIHLIALLLLFIGSGSLAVAEAPADAPANTPFRVGIEFPTQVPVSSSVERALQDMGLHFLCYYTFVDPLHTDAVPAGEVNSEIMNLCERLGMDHALETHHYDPPDAAVRQSAAFADSTTTSQKFLGAVFDEVEHIRLLYRRQLNPNCLSLTDNSQAASLNEAYENTLEGYRQLKAKFTALGAPRVVATHIWPVMLHIAARAGCEPCPKICKELYSPVSFAIGMGAAKQYGRELWVDNDLWLWAAVPGHPAEELKSNLLMAYWLGADYFYVEGAGYNLMTAGKQGLPFSLMTPIMEGMFQLTAHGEVLRWFCREYQPKHPRPWTFRDVRPNVAIIRFEDTDHGQSFAGWDDELYGSRQLHSTADTRAWFSLWNLLTHGSTGRDGLTWFKTSMGASGEEYTSRTQGFFHNYNSMPKFAARHTFFSPLNGVVMYDHLVEYDLLKDIPLLCLTGVEVSSQTMTAIRRCVAEGATCLAWGPLARRNGFGDWDGGVKVYREGKGKFVLTDDFNAMEAWKECQSLIGSPYEIRYRFGEHTVVLQRVTDNEIRVIVDGIDKTR